MAESRVTFTGICVIICGVTAVSGAEVRCNTTCPCPDFNAWNNLRYYPFVGGNASSFISCGYYEDTNGTDFTAYELFSCPTGFSFVPRKSKDDSSLLCEPTTQTGSPFDCTGEANRNVPFPQNPNLYYTCDSSQNVTALNTCPYGMYYNENAQKCDLKCNGVGTFPYALALDDSSPKLCNFYTCTYDFLYLRFNLVTHVCSPGTYFEETLLVCVTGESTFCAS